MRRVGQTRRRDQNERQIIDGMRKFGAEVWSISGPGAPDVLVRYRGRLSGLEIKTAKGSRTSAQEVSQFPIVRSLDEALVAIGARMRETTGADD